MIRRTLTLVSIAATAALAAPAEAGVPKDDWPRINGELWINSQDLHTSHAGTRRNDELLGGHGNDRVHGRRGADVIWGDHKATNNTTAQADVLRGGRGADWIYGSHGYNQIHGGRGDDTIRVWFGRGFVDCGAGDDDILYVSHASGPGVGRRHCERVSHKSARDAVHDRDR
jgi:Ca2+-binding RTX toxin-like protein